MRYLAILPLLALAACAPDTTAPATVPADYRAMLEARALTLRADLTRYRASTAAAVDSLPLATPGAQRVRVEVAQLARTADSLAIVTAQIAALPR